MSYGTYLGATYANLFPRRVGRLVLDGNVAPEAWTNGGRPNPRLGLLLRVGGAQGAASTLAAFLRICGQRTGGLRVLGRQPGRDHGQVGRAARAPAASADQRRRRARHLHRCCHLSQ